MLSPGDLYRRLQQLYYRQVGVGFGFRPVLIEERCAYY